jgi:transposase
MDVHKNAPMTPKGREAMVRSVVEGGLSCAEAAYQYNTTPKTVAKWVKRFREEGVEGLLDRSSKPHSSPGQTPAATCAAIEALRRQRHTGKQIAAEVKVSPATVSRVLRRLGLNRIRDLEPIEPVRRYEHDAPGEMIHIDIKKLGRFAQSGHRVTGNRIGYSHCRDLGLKHIRTKPYTPRTNGKAERFIQTALREWAYAHIYPTSDRRAAQLPIWLHQYNWHRPHGGIKSQTPISRLGLAEDNLLRLHT